MPVRESGDQLVESKVFGRPPSGFPFGRPFSKSNSRLTRLLLISAPDPSDRKPSKPRTVPPCSVSLPWGSKLGSVRRGLVLPIERPFVADSIDDSGFVLEVEGQFIATPQPPVEEFGCTNSQVDAFIRSGSLKGEEEDGTLSEEEEWRLTYGSSETASLDPLSPRVTVPLTVITEHNLSARLNDLAAPIVETSRADTSEFDTASRNLGAISNPSDERSVEAENTRVRCSVDDDANLSFEINIDDLPQGIHCAENGFNLGMANSDNERHEDDGSENVHRSFQSSRDAKTSRVLCRATTTHSFSQFDPDSPDPPQRGADLQLSAPYDDVRSSASSIMSSISDAQYLENTLSTTISTHDAPELLSATFIALSAQQVRESNNEWELKVFQRPPQQPPQMPSWPCHSQSVTKAPAAFLGYRSNRIPTPAAVASKATLRSRRPVQWRHMRNKDMAKDTKGKIDKSGNEGLLRWHETRKQSWRRIGKFASGQFAPARGPGRAGGWQPPRSPRETLHEEDITLPCKLSPRSVDARNDVSFPHCEDAAQNLRKGFKGSARSSVHKPSKKIARKLIEDKQEESDGLTQLSSGSVFDQAMPRLTEQASEVSLPFVENCSYSDDDEPGPNLAGLRLPSPTFASSESQDTLELPMSALAGVNIAMMSGRPVVVKEVSLPTQPAKLSRRHTSPGGIGKAAAVNSSETRVQPVRRLLTEDSLLAKPAIICMSTAADIQQQPIAASPRRLSSTLRAITHKSMRTHPVPASLGDSRKQCPNIL